MAEGMEAVRANLRHVIRGKDEAIDLLLVCLLAEGHALIEDVPGVGKTTLAKALATSIHASCRRIQFTPDLLPMDITGGMVYSPKTGEFSFRPGPIFCHILLADEVNRASPRTQSALLEAMCERQVTIEGRTHPLASPFMVIATQNPLEYQGTYPLPEAQLDRFAMRLALGYPSPEMEQAVVLDQRSHHPLEDIQGAMDQTEVVALQQRVRTVAVDESLAQYIVALVRATREDARIKLGASPRAGLTLYRAAQARALLAGRDYVIPDDLKCVAPPVLVHRFSLDLKARHSGQRNRAVVDEILASVAVPG